MKHIINGFNYLVIALNKNYDYKVYETDLPYILRPGDKIFRCIYENRGSWYKGTIIDVSEMAVSIEDEIMKKIITLPFEHEPEEGYFCKPEQRKLIIYPFPPFREKPNFRKLRSLKQNEKPFAISLEDPARPSDYLPNLKNVVLGGLKQKVAQVEQVKQLTLLSEEAS